MHAILYSTKYSRIYLFVSAKPRQVEVSCICFAATLPSDKKYKVLVVQELHLSRYQDEAYPMVLPFKRWIVNNYEIKYQGRNWITMT